MPNHWFEGPFEAFWAVKTVAYLYKVQDGFYYVLCTVFEIGLQNQCELHLGMFITVFDRLADLLQSKNAGVLRSVEPRHELTSKVWLCDVLRRLAWRTVLDVACVLVYHHKCNIRPCRLQNILMRWQSNYKNIQEL